MRTRSKRWEELESDRRVSAVVTVNAGRRMARMGLMRFMGRMGFIETIGRISSMSPIGRIIPICPMPVIVALALMLAGNVS